MFSFYTLRAQDAEQCLVLLFRDVTERIVSMGTADFTLSCGKGETLLEKIL